MGAVLEKIKYAFDLSSRLQPHNAEAKSLPSELSLLIRRGVSAAIEQATDDDFAKNPYGYPKFQIVVGSSNLKISFFHDTSLVRTPFRELFDPEKGYKDERHFCVQVGQFVFTAPDSLSKSMRERSKEITSRNAPVIDWYQELNVPRP